MNLDSLRQIKIEDFIKKPVVLVQVGIIIFGLISAKKIYQNQMKKVEQINLEIENETQLNTINQDIRQLNEKIEGYKGRALPSKDMSIVINRVTQFAREADIKFSSIRPQAVRQEDIYFYLSLSLSSDVDSFNKLGEFISLIENSDIFLQIDSFRFSSSGSLTKDKRINEADLKVTAFYLIK